MKGTGIPKLPPKTNDIGFWLSFPEKLICAAPAMPEIKGDELFIRTWATVEKEINSISSSNNLLFIIHLLFEQT